MTYRAPLLRLFLPGILALLLGGIVTFIANRQEQEVVMQLTRIAALRQEEEARPEGQAARLLVPGTTLGLAQSALQGVVRARLSLASLSPDRIDPGPPEAGRPLTRLPLTMTFAGREEQVMTALIALDSAEPLLRIDHVALEGQGVEGGAVQADLSLSAFVGEMGQ